MFKLSKPQLDTLATLFGAIAGICGVCITQEVGNPKVVGTIGGISTVLLGAVSNRPATASPSTEDVEESNILDPPPG